MDHLRLPARMESLHPALEALGKAAEALGFPERRVRHLELAVEEALVNLFSYAYCGGIGDVEIRWASPREGLMVIDILDRGTFFPPEGAPPPDTRTDLLERGVGGLGLYLLGRMVDAMGYVREAGVNRLRLVFSREGGGTVMAEGLLGEDALEIPPEQEV